MFTRYLAFWKIPDLSSFDQTITRELLIQLGRIVIIDDEQPLLIQELHEEGFSVDHDKTGSDYLRQIEGQVYDIAIIDYHGVGNKLGIAQGLDLLKHVRRVSPRTRTIAYTSRSLNANESDFFKQSHAVLPKDMGLGDSLKLIESELQKSFSKEYLLETLLAKLNMTGAADKKRIHKALAKALVSGDRVKFSEMIAKCAGTAAEKAVGIIISRLFLGE